MLDKYHYQESVWAGKKYIFIVEVLIKFPCLKTSNI